LIGGLAAAAAIGLWSLFPASLASVMVVVLLLAASGGFHMDGLSDTADGLLSSRPKERILEIMKDSHIGAMGVIAIVGVLLLKVTALAVIGEADVWRAVFLMPVAGRCALVIGVGTLPPARPEDGLGRLFCEKRSPLLAFWAAGLLAAAGWFTWQSIGLIATAITLLVIVAFSLKCYGKIGGATGDTLGATCELAETAVVVALAAKHMHLLA
jgi:adenosylcobinamide-GDP ribazoletransferase